MRPKGHDKRAEQEEAKTPIPSTRENLSADERRAHRNHGERVVAGQRLMQSASDIFLGWTRGVNYYFRQLRDVKISAVIEAWDVTMLRELCAWAPARAHARSGDPAQIAGYMGSNSSFTMRSASSRSSTPTRTFATTAPSSGRCGKDEFRLLRRN